MNIPPINYFIFHPRDVFSWGELIADGLKYGKWSSPISLDLVVKVCQTFQEHLDVAGGFYSFQKLLSCHKKERYYWFFEAFSSAAYLILYGTTFFVQKDLKNPIKSLGIASDVIRDGYYFYAKWEENKLSFLNLCYVISSVACSVLATYSLMTGKENPLLSIILSTTYLSSKVSTYYFDN